MKIKLTKLILLFGISWLFFLAIQTSVLTQLDQLHSSQPLIVKLADTDIKKQAKSIIVKIFSDSLWGSGIIIKQEKNSPSGKFDYTIVTNAHVLRDTKPPYKIQTSDNKTHQAQRLKTNFGNTDLALLQFSTKESYPPGILNPAFTKGLLSKETEVLAIGYPIDQSKGLTLLRGKIMVLLSQSLSGGSQIGFSATVEQGMSGGALLNQQGQVIGIIERENNPPFGYPRAYKLDNNLPLIVPKELMLPSSWAIPIETLVTKAKQNQINFNLAWDNLPKTQNQLIVTQLDKVRAELAVKSNDSQNVGFTLTIKRDDKVFSQPEDTLNITGESVQKKTLQVLDLDNDLEPEIIVDIQHKNKSCLHDIKSYIYRYNSQKQQYEKVLQHDWKNIPFYSFEDMGGDGKLEIKSFDGRFACVFTEKYDTQKQQEALPLQIWHYSQNKLEVSQPSQYLREYKNHALKLLSYYQTQSDYWSSHSDELQGLLAAYLSSNLLDGENILELKLREDLYPFPDRNEYLKKLKDFLQNLPVNKK